MVLGPKVTRNPGDTKGSLFLLHWFSFCRDFGLRVRERGLRVLGAGVGEGLGLKGCLNRCLLLSGPPSPPLVWLAGLGLNINHIDTMNKTNSNKHHHNNNCTINNTNKKHNNTMIRSIWALGDCGLLS